MEHKELQPITEAEEEIYLHPSTFVLEVGNIHPYVAFSALTEWLGKPTVEFNDDEEWSWRFKAGQTYLAVYKACDDFESWKLLIYQAEKNQEKANQVTEDFLRLLRKHLPRHLNKLKAAAPQATGYVFQNPFAVYFRSARDLLERASFLVPEEDTGWDDPIKKEERLDYCRSAFFLFVASFEGLLNLIYELYLKSDLRDERISSRLSREQIDVKLRLAPLFCLCFGDSVIDHHSEEFQRFQYVVNLRNDFVHANLTKPMRTTIITERNHDFVLLDESPAKYGLPRSIVQLDVDHIKFVQGTIDRMVRLALDAMKPRYAHEFKPVVMEDNIWVSVVDNEYIIQQ
jgi:hypothetical protein